jgi:hypothetical protein
MADTPIITKEALHPAFHLTSTPQFVSASLRHGPLVGTPQEG